MCNWHRVEDELPQLNYMVGPNNTSKIVLGLRLLDDELIPRLVRYVSSKFGYYWVDDQTDEIITVKYWASIEMPVQTGV